MKSVVMIAYFFPPEGGAGAYRPLRFIRHLSLNGWRTIVVSSNRLRHDRYDPELIRLVPHDAKVIRPPSKDLWQRIQEWRARRLRDQEIVSSASAKSLETTNLILTVEHAPLRSRIRQTIRAIEAWHYYPDMAKPWIRPAVAATIDICVRERPDVIWATAGPMSAWIVAQQVSNHTGVPYVLDLRDPWGLNYYESELRRPRSIKQLDRRNMSQILMGAQAVVFLFDSVAECYKRAYPNALDPAKIHIIPNGYDGTIDACPRPASDRCLILYTGTLSSYRYDTLLEALRRLKTCDPERARQLHLMFVGEGTAALANEASALNLSEIVTTRPPMPYAQVEQLQKAAHAFLVLGRPRERKDYELLAGAKLFAYLRIGQPIVGVLPLDETRKVLQRVGITATIADIDSPAEIVAVLQRLLEAWSTKTLPLLAPDPVACATYSAERQTRALICALEGMPAAKSFAPESVRIQAAI